MGKEAIGMALVLGALFGTLALRDPLGAASLTAGQREAGLRSVDLEVNGENCRFCRINVERSLQALSGVRLAKADMAHHRARVVYDPRLVQTEALVAAIRGIGIGAVPLNGATSPLAARRN
jgi:Cu2+-exporting ATPase